MRPFSNDLRLRIHEARQAGESTSDVAERFGVSTAFVRRLEQRFRLTGYLAPRSGGHGPATKLDGLEEELLRAVAERPDATAAEHRERLKRPASRVTVWRAMRRLGLTRKKKSTRASEQDRPVVDEARRAWLGKMAGIAPRDLVFLDETGQTPPCSGPTATPRGAGGWSPLRRSGTGRR